MFYFRKSLPARSNHARMDMQNNELLYSLVGIMVTVMLWEVSKFQIKCQHQHRTKSSMYSSREIPVDEFETAPCSFNM
jgi:hypothetical protein